jgi:hypothetical protein
MGIAGNCRKDCVGEEITMKEIFKQTISAIYIDEDSQYLVFIAKWGEPYWVYHASAECCSRSWFESINNPENLLCEEIIDIEEKPDSETNGESCDRHDYFATVYGYTLKTNKGYTDIEFRNSSNGYYGGSCEFVPDAKLIFPVIEDTQKPYNFTYNTWNVNDLVKEKKYVSKDTIIFQKMPFELEVHGKKIKIYPYDQKPNIKVDEDGQKQEADWQTKSYDDKGNVIKCDKCEKYAEYHLLGKEDSINLCGDHSPYANSPVAKLIYLPKDLQKKIDETLLVPGSPKILQDVWDINLKGFKGEE